MADAWVRMRDSLVDHIEVLSLGTWLGTTLGTSPGTGGGTSPGLSRKMLRRIVVGMLLETWGLFHREADETGLLRGVDGLDLDEFVGVPSWAEALLGVGWIDVTPDGVRACGFEKYIGSRKANQEHARKKKRAQRAAAKTGDEHVPGDKGGPVPRDVPGDVLTSLSSSGSPSLSLSERGTGGEAPPHADDEPRVRTGRCGLAKALAEPEFAEIRSDVRDTAESWRAFRVEARMPAWTVTTWRTQLRTASANPTAFAASVALSIGNRWQGLFPAKAEAPKRANGYAPQSIQSIAEVTAAAMRAAGEQRPPTP